MIFVPYYYQNFKCIADQCRHNCCIGWEIEIDAESLARYQQIRGSFGEQLRKGILQSGNEASFKLDEKERCFFLDQQGLCKIYRELGEDHLCAICKDHPRFRNFFSDRIEMGLGLCCEEAARLILNQSEPFRLVALKSGKADPTAEESAFYAFRQNLFQTLQNRAIPMAERLPKPAISPAEWAAFYLTLERLNSAWTPLLERLKGTVDWLLPDQMERPLEQLAVYFLYRHLPDGIWEGTLLQRRDFAFLSVWMIATLRQLTGESLEDLARLYSAEIEYSDENLQAILKKL